MAREFQEFAPPHASLAAGWCECLANGAAAAVELHPDADDGRQSRLAVGGEIERLLRGQQGVVKAAGGCVGG